MEKTLVICAIIKHRKSEEYQGFFLTPQELSHFHQTKNYYKYTWVRTLDQLKDHPLYTTFKNFKE